MSVYFYGCTSIDGYLADSQHSLDWLYSSGTTEETSYDNFYKGMDITIMGRKTFNEVAKMQDPSSYYPTTENYVFTSDKGFNVSGFHKADGNIVDFIRGIDPSKNVWIIGGSSLVAPLLDEGLIDVLYIQIAPVLLGAGIPLFSQQEGLKRFSLIEVNQYGVFAEMVYKKL